jgi:hypothetical protein
MVFGSVLVQGVESCWMDAVFTRVVKRKNGAETGWRVAMVWRVPGEKRVEQSGRHLYSHIVRHRTASPRQRDPSASCTPTRAWTRVQQRMHRAATEPSQDVYENWLSGSERKPTRFPGGTTHGGPGVCGKPVRTLNTPHRRGYGGLAWKVALVATSHVPYSDPKRIRGSS